MKYFGWVGHGLRKGRLDFGGNPGRSLDPGYSDPGFKK